VSEDAGIEPRTVATLAVTVIHKFAKKNLKYELLMGQGAKEKG
jgi:hypothetical protein